MILPEIAEKCLVDEVLGVVHFHLQLFENDTLLLLDVGSVEARIQDEVGEQIECDGQVLVQDLDVVADQFLRGVGVKIAACRIGLPRDLLGRSIGRSLEEHVLDEVRDAVVFGCFSARAGADPHTYADRSDMRNGLGNDSNAVGQSWCG